MCVVSVDLRCGALVLLTDIRVCVEARTSDIIEIRTLFINMRQSMQFYAGLSLW